MANVIIPQRFWVRRGTAAALTAANEVLYSGEWCLESDTGRMKCGDGLAAWNDLGYSVPGRADLTGLQDGDALIYSGSGDIWLPGVQVIDVNDLVGFPGGTTDVLRADGSFGPVAAGGGARGYANARLKVAGGSVGLADYGGTPTTIAAATNGQYFQPFSVERTITVATLYAEVTTLQATSVFRLGIYDNDESGSIHVPGTLLGQTGDLSGAATGNVGGALTPGVTLTPGLVYWSAMFSRGGNATFRAHPIANFPPAWLGRSVATNNNAYNHYRLTASWSVMPSTYPGSGAITSAAVPAVFLTE